MKICGHLTCLKLTLLIQVCFYLITLQLTTNAARPPCPPAFPDLLQFFKDVPDPQLQQLINSVKQRAKHNCSCEAASTNIGIFNDNRCNVSLNITKPAQCLPGYIPPVVTTATSIPTTVITEKSTSGNKIEETIPTTKGKVTTYSTTSAPYNQTDLLALVDKDGVNVAVIVIVTILALLICTFIVAMALYRYCVGKWCCSCCGLCPQKPKNLTLEKIPGVYYINHAALGDISNGSSPQAPEEGFDGMVIYANPFITSNGKSGFTVTPRTAEDKKNPMFKENNPSLNGSVAHNNSSKKSPSNGFTPHRKMKNKKLQRPKSALETLNPVEMGYYISENPSAIERDKLGNDSNDNIYSNQAAVLDITQNAQFSTVERQNRQNVHTEQNIKTMDDPDQWVPTKKKKKEKKSKKENLDDFCYSNDWAMENEISEVSKPEAANQTYI